jgi:hypothetical protein
MTTSRGQSVVEYPSVLERRPAAGFDSSKVRNR